ncbi:BNR/Asp-box repeat protein [Bernardetia litoralis DSM 6794]|uniref:BNR/Asp-box repeat protein n=1 Tax=Bernardetia litoralis (strain ATCC 23117 / DSM 6794 / NBRC 15988 / NCIMB 1366 / Fx l1 / Sio-4) TaxID=880071 RepID=I4AJH3_BERLS|nr:exo-alpha-sialidase [Bernardetia litoralis]AFM04108.1 BNR/Asp-box repeat protein [Bernardetia litoralis DSM 6794]
MKRYFLTFLTTALFTSSVIAQDIQLEFTKTENRINSQNESIKKLEDSWLKNVPIKSIGPTIMSGRVADIEVNPNNPTEFLAAFASGGLWYTNTNGTSFTPLFQNQRVMSIGDIAVNWENSTIWVGTGEKNSSRSSYSGDGVYVSYNMGKTWEHKSDTELNESQHIGRIILHPTDKNTLWVAALGHLYSKNKERGVYKTTDGGKTWKKTLFVDENTGAVDLIIDPKNPNILYTATWQRHRAAWDFEEAGIGSGIYRSDDAGENWTKLTTKESGFLVSEGIGRIGLTISKANPDWIYACLDNQDRKPKAKETNKTQKTKLSGEALLTMTKEQFLKIPDAELTEYLRKNRFPKKYNTTFVKTQIKEGKIQPKALVEFLGDANSRLFDTPVKGLEVYLSKDKGKTWQKTHEGSIDEVVYSYGYYFGEIRVSQINPKKLYVLGVPLITSDDGGKNWKSINKDNVHADHQALWLNPKKDGHLINGNDGGINITYNDGKTWSKQNSIPVGQFYSVATDRAEPYNVYGGLQDNGVWTASHEYEYSNSWQEEGNYPYKRLLGGDGMQVEIDFRDNNTVYTCYQFGNCFKIDKTTSERNYITPSHELGQKPFRFNWQTPLHLSKHQENILYMGSNYVHRSFDQGKTWETISEDLTRGKNSKGAKNGDVAYNTLTSIDESALRFGLLYVGSDDGMVHVSKDAGFSWENISQNYLKEFPKYKNFWVSRVIASQHKMERVYITLNGYRFDNFESIIFVSNDFGKTWTQIGKDLPLESVNVIREDSKTENLLFVGTDHNLYASLDAGISFMPLGKDFPRVAVHDLSVQPVANHLVVGTHGRSLFVIDIAPLQSLSATKNTEKSFFLQKDKVKYNKNWGRNYWSKWAGNYEPNEEDKQFIFFAPKKSNAEIRILDKNNMILHSEKLEANKGLNYWNYDLTINEEAAKKISKSLSTKAKTFIISKSDNEKYYLPISSYKIVLIENGKTTELPFEIVEK